MNTQNTQQSELPDEKYVNSILIKLLEYDKPITAYELLSITARNYNVLMKRLKLLESGGYIKIEEAKQHGSKGRRIYLIQLTDKGRIVAEALKQAEWLAKLPPEMIERMVNMTAYIHINTYDDHITLKEIHLGKSRIVDVFVRPRGNTIYLYCDYHRSEDCDHIEVIFADHKLSDYIRDWLKKNGYKLAKKYEKYVEKYW